MSKQDNPFTEQRRKQKEEGSNGKPKVTKIKSNVEDYKNIKWKRDTGNPFIDNVEIIEEDITAILKIGDETFNVRMPDRRLVKKRDWIRKRYNPETDTYDIEETKEAYDKTLTLEKVQEQIIEDMLPGFEVDNPPIRFDEIMYNQLSAFVWTFYHFFVLKSRGQQNVGFSSPKG